MIYSPMHYAYAMSVALSLAKQHPVGPASAAARALAVFCLTAGALGAGELAAQAEHRVGLADHRGGYESSDYATESEAILEHLGARLPLASLASSPPLGLPTLTEPLQAEEVNLGRTLFFDRRLSANANLSCGMCHVPEQGYTQNELATPVGDEGRGGRRNAPSLYNIAFQQALFWDGRETSLEAQVWSPLLARNEMANPDRETVIKRLADIPAYRTAFDSVYEDGLTEATLGRALAAYQRALVSADSAFDRWYFDNPDYPEPIPGFDGQAAKGFQVFTEQGCSSCHTLGRSDGLFTDGGFHNTGTGFLRNQRGHRPQRVQVAPGIYVVPQVDVETEVFTDDGRVEVSGDSADQWRYRTPSLRNVALTAPYMHDGSLTSLAAVVAFYVGGGGGDPNQDARIRPLTISQDQQAALVAFLESLTASNVDALVADARSAAIGDRLRHDYRNRAPN